ncbi:hypothetical protein JMA_02690 [Jeotgalibacillus malaysiensis]|uniref:Uncharacterized protein n=1 Tax=Jeotgalibacillus malaysiensis TaxID=1508404 RepID=A0A0B5AHN2_9BACL|nr:hypothetical protein JMA_02690 [Jeotgalibacillus malaysiensis]
MTVIPFLINIAVSLFMIATGYYAWHKSKANKRYFVVSIILMVTGIIAMLVNGVTAIVV